MSHGNIALTEICKGVLVENLVNQSQILVVGENASVVYYDSAGFLPPVLQGVQTDVGLHCRVRGLIAVYGEYAAFLMYTAEHSDHSFPSQQ